MSLDAMKQALEALEDVTKERGYARGTTLFAITALRAAIEQAQEPETELETYKRLYELRGKALERPCSNCGHQPAKIKAMAQPEYKPRQWQGLTQREIDQLWDLHHDDYGNALSAIGYERAIEAKLKEKNT